MYIYIYKLCFKPYKFLFKTENDQISTIKLLANSAPSAPALGSKTKKK